MPENSISELAYQLGQQFPYPFSSFLALSKKSRQKDIEQTDEGGRYRSYSREILRVHSRIMPEA